MAVKKYKPTTPGQRNKVISAFTEITAKKPHKSLLEPLHGTGGRNNTGQLTMRYIGGGHKKMYRVIDFLRDKDNCTATVRTIEYDPNRTARIALVQYEDGEYRYIIAPEGLKVGQVIASGSGVAPEVGNTLPLSEIPVGTLVHNIELRPGQGATMARSAGAFAQLAAREGNHAILRLPSGETRMVLVNCRATVGTVSNGDHNLVYDRVAEHGIAFLNWDKTVREATGLRFKDAFAAVCDTLQHFWAADEAARGPFMTTTTVTPVPGRFTEYGDLESVGDKLFATREGLTVPDQLVQVLPDGKVRPVAHMGAYTSGPMYSEPMGRLYWSEVVRDARWPLRSYSIIRSYDGSGVKKLTRKTRYYNPVPAPEEQVLSVTEYPTDGTSRVVLLDAADGRRLREWRAPDGLQVVETAWVGDELFASGISEAGAGLYRVDGFEPIVGPSPVSISALWTMDDRLMFTSDLTGVNELYALDPADGRVERLTNLRFGASEFEPNGDSLYFPVLQREGRLIHKVAISDLQPQEADFSQAPQRPFAEELAAGETEAIDWNAPVELSDPKPYHKLGHLFRFHSWLPFYLEYDSEGTMP